jgi:hypothetical protein
MPEPLSALMLGGYAALHAVVRRNTAVSDEAANLRQAVADMVVSGEQVESLHGERNRLIRELWLLQDECSVPDWDGCDSLPLSQVAVQRTTQLLRQLPEGFPLPEIAAEPDGSVSLDWMASRSRMVSVSIGESDRLAFAWLDGTDNGHAVAKHDGVIFPNLILDVVLSISR